MTQQPPPNWLAPTAGGVVLLFLGLVFAFVGDAAGPGIVAALIGAVIAAFGLAKRDRYTRYGR